MYAASPHARVYYKGGALVFDCSTGSLQFFLTEWKQASSQSFGCVAVRSVELPCWRLAARLASQSHAGSARALGGDLTRSTRPRYFEGAGGG